MAGAAFGIETIFGDTCAARERERERERDVSPTSPAGPARARNQLGVDYPDSCPPSCHVAPFPTRTRPDHR